MGSKIEVEMELKVSSEKLWKNLKEFVKSLPKALPDIYESIVVVEGDGASVGSVLATTFKPSEFNPVHWTVKERIDVVDEEKKVMRFSYIEGEILDLYKNFKSSFCVSSSKSGDGSLVKCLGEFEKANADVPNPHFFKDLMLKVFHDWDAYLLNPTHHH